jgi:hypothetical protein
MKKNCPICQKAFSGRSDKMFCSVECKNQFHNEQRKQGLVNTIDQTLHHNRTILQQLMPPAANNAILERVVLERLGFQFDNITGLATIEPGKVLRKVYEFLWSEHSDGKISVERVLQYQEQQLAQSYTLRK